MKASLDDRDFFLARIYAPSGNRLTIYEIPDSEHVRRINAAGLKWAHDFPVTPLGIEPPAALRADIFLLLTLFCLSML